MRVELGAHIWTREGKDIGTVDRLILDPETNNVKAVVVRQGGILPADVMIELDRLDVDDTGRLRVAYTADQIDQLPPFFESDYTEPPPTGFVPTAAGYPGVGLAWPIGYGMVPPVYPAMHAATDDDPESRARQREIERRIAENSVIDVGSDVRALDGEKVGEVHRLVFDTATGRLAHLIARKGFLFTNEFELPLSAINRVDDGVIVLAADKTAVAAWSDAGPGVEVWTNDDVLLGIVERRSAHGLEVVRSDDGSRLHVPLVAVAGLSDGRLRLGVGAVQASHWQAPPSPDVEAGPRRTLL